VKPYTPDDAEAAMRAALDSGDAERIAVAATRVDAFDVAPVLPSLLSSALWYASVGLRVFPLSPRSKIPLKGSAGCKDATTDEATIRAWWEVTPDANIGIATGHLVDVVDIDGLEGQRSRARMWEETFAQIDADSLAKILTPRAGGMHIFVPATGDGNKAGICPGVDYRGAGGYVVAPPSVTDQGSYRFLGMPNFGGLSA
jgi:hypothetical protein